MKKIVCLALAISVYDACGVIDNAGPDKASDVLKMLKKLERCATQRVTDTTFAPNRVATIECVEHANRVQVFMMKQLEVESKRIHDEIKRG